MIGTMGGPINYDDYDDSDNDDDDDDYDDVFSKKYFFMIILVEGLSE